LYALDSTDVILLERAEPIAEVLSGQAEGTHKFRVVQREGDIVTGGSDFVLRVLK
jgi:hypothetical protein